MIGEQMENFSRDLEIVGGKPNGNSGPKTYNMK